mmetsp:Transcript_1366/g.3157  ORF Transcript_1366/g.3157 Transcript_1366/m.3157 type:complete len:224 (-) Transcript_1366:398-1069(-)
MLAAVACCESLRTARAPTPTRTPLTRFPAYCANLQQLQRHCQRAPQHPQAALSSPRPPFVAPSARVHPNNFFARSTPPPGARASPVSALTPPPDRPTPSSGPPHRARAFRVFSPPFPSASATRQSVFAKPRFSRAAPPFPLRRPPLRQQGDAWSSPQRQIVGRRTPGEAVAATGSTCGRKRRRRTPASEGYFHPPLRLPSGVKWREFRDLFRPKMSKQAPCSL